MKMLFCILVQLIAISLPGTVEKTLQDDLIYITEADYSDQNDTVMIQSPINFEFSEFAVTSLTEDETRNQKELKIYAALLDTYVPENPVPT